MKLIMTKGLPGSGKSTWAREQVSLNDEFRRVNKDDLRMMINGGVWNQEFEKEIVQIRDSLIDYWFIRGHDIIVDDTGFNPVHEKRFRQLCDRHNATFEIKIFDTPLQECIDRDSERLGPARVGEKVIRDMYKKYGDQIYVI